MIAKGIGLGRGQGRGSPSAFIKKVIAITCYICNADTSLLHEAGIGLELGHGGSNDKSDASDSFGEKVCAAGVFNLEGSSLESWQACLAATALLATETREPLKHFVVSWRPGEVPDEEQLAKAAGKLCELLGARACQAIWAAHSNTKNLHIHVLINRALPDGTLVQLGDGWDRDALAQACAVIEAEQGWAPEQNAIYVANKHGEVHQISDNLLVRSAAGEQLRISGDRAADLAAWREQPDIMCITEILLAAPSWAAMHDELQKRVCTILPKDPGGVVIVDDKEFKVSRFSAEASWAKLVGRLGDYESTNSLDLGMSVYRERKAQLAQLEKEAMRERGAVMAVLTREKLAVIRDICASTGKPIQKSTRQAIDAGRLAANQAVHLEFSRYAAMIHALKQTPSEWIANPNCEEPKESLPKFLFPAWQNDDVDKRPAGYATKELDKGLEYQTKFLRTRAFTDYGLCIVIHSESDADIVAALQLAATRWKPVEIFGDVQFQRRAMALAAKNDILALADKVDQPPTGQAFPFNDAPEPVSAAQPSSREDTAPTTSIDPYVFVKVENYARFCATVRKAGFEVGDGCPVQFDYDVKAYRIDTEQVTKDEFDQLAKSLSDFRTRLAKNQSMYESNQIAEFEAMEADRIMVANFEKAEAKRKAAHSAVEKAQKNSANPEFADTPSHARPEPVSSQLHGVDSNPALSLFGHHPLIDAFARIPSDRGVERDAAAVAVASDDGAKRASGGLSQEHRRMLDECASRGLERNRKAAIAQAMRRGMGM